MSRRIEFQAHWVSQTAGRIANIGCAEDPLHISDMAPGRVINIDMNRWRLPNVIQCDAHHLPLKENAVELALLGDILEHVIEPLDVLKEAKRIAKRMVVTTFEDHRLPSPGRHVDFGQKSLKDSLEQFGFNSIEEQLLTTGVSAGTLPEAIMSHSPHIWWFTPKIIAELVQALDMNILYFGREPELVNISDHPCWLFWNYLLALEKKEAS